MHKSNRDYLLGLLSLKPVHPPEPLISKWAEKKRMLPINTPFPGPWENKKTKYSVEIMDNMSPYSPVKRTVVMKGAQLGLTAAAENVVGYWMDESPTEILLLSASEALVVNWATKRLEPLIDSIGMREKIFVQSGSEKTRRSADKVFSKEYTGGMINLGSAQAASSLRSDSKRVLIRDEVDGAPPLLKSGEGNWLSVSEARTEAWGSRVKILDFSTPTELARSLIYPAYLEGDQRKYLVPCPHCKKDQELEWLEPSETNSYGLKDDTKGGVLLDVVYICKFCREAMFNYHKGAMIPKGNWHPTVTSVSRDYRSYHLSSLYSPVGMLSWKGLWEKYLAALKAPEGLRSFTTLYVGIPYQETGYRPRIEKVLEFQGGYKRGTVPYGVLFITIGVDVQRGSEGDPNNPPRIEMEILGHGAGFRTWSIDYWRFEGPVADPFSGAWELFAEKAEEMGLTWEREDGQQFGAQMIFVDSGDGTTQATVEAFCERWPGTFPIKGFQTIQRRAEDKKDVDAELPSNYLRYRAQKIGSGESLYYSVATNYYKTMIYNRLNSIQRIPQDPQKPGFMDFPVDYPESYFRMLTAEEKRKDGSFISGGRRNESLDCKVYAMCAADVYLDGVVMGMRARARKKGASPQFCDQITKRTALEALSKQANVEFPLSASE